MNRHIAAFLLAPLIVPLLMGAIALPLLRDVPCLYALGLMIAAAVSYAGAALVCAPAYVALRSVRWTAFFSKNLHPLFGIMLVVSALLRSIAIFVPPAPVDSVFRMSPCARTMLA